MPEDFNISKSIFKQYSATEAIVVLLTNYGLLIQKGIDISNITLGTEDYNLVDSSITIYPNPSNDIVTFLNKLFTSVSIFDINGRHVLDVKSRSFSVKDLAKGVYIVKGINEEKA